MSSYLVGVDIGGTFTDCVIINDAGQVTTAKSPSTPDDFSRGMVNAVRAGAEALGMSLEQLCEQTQLLTHGTTVGTNAVIQKKGAKVGLITTKGHNDVIHIMRGSRGLTGRDLKRVVQQYSRVPGRAFSRERQTRSGYPQDIDPGCVGTG